MLSLLSSAATATAVVVRRSSMTMLLRSSVVVTGQQQQQQQQKQQQRRSYHETIVEHYENPRNVGSLDKNDPNVGTGLVGAPACGDVMKLQIRVNPVDGTIMESKFKTFGCGSAIASSSVATEWIKGQSIHDVTKIKNSDIAAHLKLPPVKLHCSMLAEDAIKAAVQDWKSKQQQQVVTGGAGEESTSTSATAAVA